LIAVVRLVAPSGRAWERARWTEDGLLRGRLGVGLSVLGPHSTLQEPHGGEVCAAGEHALVLPIWETLARHDGPRAGRGTLTASIVVHAPRAGHLAVSGTVRECTLHTDLPALLDRLPENFSGLDPYATEWENRP